MKNRRIIYVLVALSLFSLPGFSQNLMNQGNGRGAGWLTGELPNNSRFSLEIGTGFSTFSSGASLLGNYISPVFEYDLNPSFTVIAGGRFSYNQYNNLPQPMVMNVNSNNFSPFQQGLAGHSMFLGGRYMINENLFMTGTVYREQGSLPLSLMNPEAYQYTTQGMTMGFEYKVSDSFRFGAEVGINRSNNPYQYYSPFLEPFSNRQGRSRYNLSPF